MITYFTLTKPDSTFLRGFGKIVGSINIKKFSNNSALQFDGSLQEDQLKIKFVKDLIAKVPVPGGLIKGWKNIIGSLEQAIRDDSISNLLLDDLSGSCPTLYIFLSKILIDGSPITKVSDIPGLDDIFNRLINRCNVFDIVLQAREKIITGLEFNADVRTFDAKTGSCVPGTNQNIRALPSKEYTAGHRAYGIAVGVNDDNEVDESWEADTSNSSCFKDGAGKNHWLVPGIFTICCMHGFIIGFFIMWKPESPETAFTWLFTRRKDGNFIIIYDNACNLMMYCLRREPVFFKNSIFLIDRFHFDNHVNCTAGNFFFNVII